MGAQLPRVALDVFRDELREQVSAGGRCGRPLGELASDLARHWELVRRWNRTTSLVGLAEGECPVERHYAESLAALPWLPSAGRLLDWGTGAGFPGLVLALTGVLDSVVLAESRARKASFLGAAARELRLEVDVVARKIGPGCVELGGVYDAISIRAVRLAAEDWLWLPSVLAAEGCVFWWTTDTSEVPVGFEVSARRALGGSSRRELLCLRPAVAGDSSEGRLTK